MKNKPKLNIIPFPYFKFRSDTTHNMCQSPDNSLDRFGTLRNLFFDFFYVARIVIGLKKRENSLKNPEIHI